MDEPSLRDVCAKFITPAVIRRLAPDDASPRGNPEQGLLGLPWLADVVKWPSEWWYDPLGRLRRIVLNLSHRETSWGLV